MLVRDGFEWVVVAMVMGNSTSRCPQERPHERTQEKKTGISHPQCPQERPQDRTRRRKPGFPILGLPKSVCVMTPLLNVLKYVLSTEGTRLLHTDTCLHVVGMPQHALTMTTLQKMADAFGRQLQVSFEQPSKGARRVAVGAGR